MATTVPPRVRPYRRYLTSVLHRRFVHASGLTLLACYAEAVILGNSRSLIWSWFPLGPTGLRALSLYICCLVVFILRISQLQIGKRSTSSPFAAFLHTALRPSVLQIAAWYLFSAWWFGELYIWFSPATAQLGWVHHESLRKRDKLNERPIFLRSVYFQLALVEIVLHVYRGIDHIVIPSNLPSTKSTDSRTHKIEPVLVQIQRKGPRTIITSVVVAGITTIVSPFIYTPILRIPFWSSHLAFAKLFFSIPRSNANFDTLPPCGLSMLWRAFYTGSCLLILWEVSNFLFSTLLAQEPVKKGLPLSAESKDPNGTLLSGLRAKKDTVRTFALWELANIARSSADRRKAIFADIERTGGPTWTQMLHASLTTITSIEDRIISSQTPKKPATTSAASQPEIQTLPRLAADVKSADNIFASSPPPRSRTEKWESTIGPMARSLGQSPPWSPSAKERVKGFLEYPGQKSSELAFSANTASTPAFLPGPLRDYVIVFLRSPIGSPFRLSFPRLLSSIILSTPNAQTAQIVDAIDSTTRMLVASLSEDLYGKVQATVPVTVKTLTASINAIEALIDKMHPHWTDVDFEIRGAEIPEDVEIVLERLKSGLDDLLSAFQLYLREVGLSDADLKDAKEAVRRKARSRLPKQQVKPPQPSSAPADISKGKGSTSQPRETSSRTSSKSNGDIRPRKRLEERDRGKDLDFLNAPLPQQHTSKSKEQESSSSSSSTSQQQQPQQQKQLPPPPPEKDHPDGGSPFTFGQRGRGGGGGGGGIFVQREMEQVKR